MQETPEMRVQFLGQEDPLVKGMATPSSILAWEIPWMEEPGGLQSLGLWRVGHNSVHGHTNVVLVSAAPQCESAICVHVPPPSSLSSNPPPHPAPLGHDRAPSCTACTTQQLLTGYFTRVVCVCQCCVFSSFHPFLPMSTICSLCLCLCFCPAKHFFFWVLILSTIGAIIMV